MSVTVEPVMQSLPCVPTVLDAVFFPDQVAAWLAAQEPSPDHSVLVAMLDADRLSHSGRLDALTAVDAHLAQLSARRAILLAAMMRHPEDVLAPLDTGPAEPDVIDGLSTVSPRAAIRRSFDDPQWQSLVADVSCATRVPCSTVQAQLGDALQLSVTLPSTLHALGRGTVSPAHAAVLLNATSVIADVGVLARVEAAALGAAGEQTVAKFRRTVARAVAVHDAGGEASRHREARRERRVTMTPQPDGMASLYAFLPAVDAYMVMEAIRSRADSDRVAMTATERSQDPRCCDERRADALVMIARDCMHSGATSTADQARRRPYLRVTVPLDTLLGLSEQPGELAGYGPLSADVVRDLAADPSGVWRRLITDPLTGKLLDYGSTTYKAPPPLRRFVEARDQICSFPTCQQPAHRCDLDHITEYPYGPTSPGNLHPLCRRHHRLRHETPWKVRRKEDGYEWRTPHGRTYRRVMPSLGQLGPLNSSASELYLSASELSTAISRPDPPPSSST